MGWRPPRSLKVDSNWIYPRFGGWRRVRTVLGIFTLSAFPLGAATTFGLRVNWAEWMPRGIDQRVGPALERCAWVPVCLERDAADFSRERGYVIDASCPNGPTLVFKHVVGIPGDRIQVARHCLTVNGAVILDSERKVLDSLGLSLEHTAENEILVTEGHFFVTETNRREAGTAAISARSPRIKSHPARGPRCKPASRRATLGAARPVGEPAPLAGLPIHPPIAGRPAETASGRDDLIDRHSRHGIPTR